MRTSLQVVTPPAMEPVDSAFVKAHCRIDHNADDLLVLSYIVAARMMAEAYLSRCLVAQTLLWTLMPEWSVNPSVHFLRGALDLPRAPVQTVASISVLDNLGNQTTLSPATTPIVPPATLQGYIVDTALQPAILRVGLDTPLAGGRTLRNAPLQHMQVQFVAGYPSNGVPQPILQAILLTVAHLYEHRGDSNEEMPQSAKWLLDPFRMMWVG